MPQNATNNFHAVYLVAMDRPVDEKCWTSLPSMDNLGRQGDRCMVRKQTQRQVNSPSRSGLDNSAGKDKRFAALLIHDPVSLFCRAPP